MSVIVNNSKLIHEGKVFNLLKENITLPNNVTTDLEVIRHPGASAVVPLHKENSLILIKQYRHAVGDFIWEIPAGTFNDNETPIQCAKRELTEETGFYANVWHKLGELIPVPGYSDECIYLFLAIELSSARQNLDRDELLEVHEIVLDDAIKMIYEGSIRDCKTISGIMMAAYWLKKMGRYVIP
ncbi:MAG TPA: NUDIX hydrolase [Desulfobacteraceae bacterium]|nr:NUDIX hydrolase [Desulfobacteraceae bacterium]HPJ67512.1 NUDIX hydrolase [Desulfobacteraceae bacterium]HPQ28889.1 NUDIX hydrolase [Desulfobacteraceae bacterium]